MTNHNTQFKKDVIEGLSRPLKRLSSKYFYDEQGDKLFQKIMKLEEYYLPEAELDILKTKTEKLISGFEFDTFDVIELGAGDGTKTVHFLKNLLLAGKNITYCPLDISPDVLQTNINLMNREIPSLQTKPIPGDYFETLSKIKKSTPKVIMFMGGNIGNYDSDSAISFLKKIKSHMSKTDRLFVGIDIKKNPWKILQAYNDSQGVTKAFNLNLLNRINKELNADFDLSNFDHYPSYNPLNGTAYSFIVSTKDQVVTIDDKSFSFNEGEVIHTEVSQKYDVQMIQSLREDAGFKKVSNHYDSNTLFSISVFTDE